MKYTGTTLSFQEVPGEVSIAISISNCPHRCPGCHSAYLREDVGEELTTSTLLDVIAPYKAQHTGQYTITCICFLGGEQHKDELITLLKFVKEDLHLNTCLYTGSLYVRPEVEELLDYVKFGPYIESKGPLTSETTNQRFYKLAPTKQDLTHYFWRS